MERGSSIGLNNTNKGGINIDNIFKLWESRANKLGGVSKQRILARGVHTVGEHLEVLSNLQSPKRQELFVRYTDANRHFLLQVIENSRGSQILSANTDSTGTLTIARVSCKPSHDFSTGVAHTLKRIPVFDGENFSTLQVAVTRKYIGDGTSLEAEEAISISEVHHRGFEQVFTLDPKMIEYLYLFDAEINDRSTDLQLNKLQTHAQRPERFRRQYRDEIRLMNPTSRERHMVAAGWVPYVYENLKELAKYQFIETSVGKQLTQLSSSSTSLQLPQTLTPESGNFVIHQYDARYLIPIPQIQIPIIPKFIDESILSP